MRGRHRIKDYGSRIRKQKQLSRRMVKWEKREPTVESRESRAQNNERRSGEMVQ